MITLACCNNYAGTQSGSSSNSGTSSVPTETEKLLSSMTLEEKVWQLFYVRKGEEENYPVGGVVLFAQDIKTPEQLKNMVTELKNSNKKTAPLIAIDEEGGRITRIAENPNFALKEYESMLAVGNTGSAEKAKEVGRYIGGYLKEYGIDIDFAPVADVFTNPENTVIGNRAFSSDAKTAAKMVAAAIEGFRENGIITSAKHFPGHGDTKGDSHDGYVYTDKTWEELKNCELLPFVSAIESNVEMIMLGHISLPNVLGSKTPASLSYEIVTEKLRGELGFDGVIVTDALDMGAIINEYPDGEESVIAFLAGADILLMPENLEKSYNAVLSAVKSGKISQERLDQSVERILNLKK